METVFQFFGMETVSLLHKNWAFAYKSHILNKTAEVIEHKNQETLAENRATEYKQTMI